MAIYAIVESGGKQYKVSERQTLDLELLDLLEGDTVQLDRVLLVQDQTGVAVGRPYVPDAKVVATVMGEVKGKKVIVLKYKPKVRYHHKTGHRHRYTRVQVTRIQTSP